MDGIINFIITILSAVIVEIICYYVCKWLDEKTDD